MRNKLKINRYKTKHVLIFSRNMNKSGKYVSEITDSKINYLIKILRKQNWEYKTKVEIKNKIGRVVQIHIHVKKV